MAASAPRSLTPRSEGRTPIRSLAQRAEGQTPLRSSAPLFVPKKLDLEVRSRAAAAPMLRDVPCKGGSGLLLRDGRTSWADELDSDAYSTVDDRSQGAYASSQEDDASSQGADALGSPKHSAGAGVCVGVLLLPCAQAGGSTPTAGWSTEAELRVTSLTLLNVPAHFTELTLKWKLESLGLLSSCNFVYLPRVQAAGDGLSLCMGHALLNFVTPDDADLARSRLAGHVWDGGAGRGGDQMPAEVEDAVPQGYQACSDYLKLLTCEQTSSNSMVDWLDVPALNPGSPTLRAY